jgi:hypothetical protein
LLFNCFFLFSSLFCSLLPFLLPQNFGNGEEDTPIDKAKVKELQANTEYQQQVRQELNQERSLVRSSAASAASAAAAEEKAVGFDPNNPPYAINNFNGLVSGFCFCSCLCCFAVSFSFSLSPFFFFLGFPSVLPPLISHFPSFPFLFFSFLQSCRSQHQNSCR